MKIVVLMGGLSSERNVSLSSASLVCAALVERGHEVLAVDVYEGIENDTDISTLFTKETKQGITVPLGLPDIEAIKKSHGGREDEIGPRVIEACRTADCVFLALHGGVGENGQLQALLEAYNIRHTGSGYIGSMLAMDKDISKQMLRSGGILTPDWVRVDTSDCEDVGRLVEAVGLPAVVKPCSGGSSVGVYMVNNEQELKDAIRSASKYEKYVLVEKKIEGRELTCAYFDGRALPPVEIIPKTEFYDYVNKYQADAAEEICPADIGEAATLALYEATERGFEILRLKAYARFDYILDGEGRAWCLEANTLPGMTPTSLLPKEAAAVGIDYGQLCEKIAMMAMENNI